MSWPCPSLAIALGRAGPEVMRAELSLPLTGRRAAPAPCLGNTVELALTAKAQTSQPLGCESKRAGPAPFQLQHLGSTVELALEAWVGVSGPRAGEQQSQLCLLPMVALGGLDRAVLESLPWWCR